MTAFDPALRRALLAVDTPTVCNALEIVLPVTRGRGVTSTMFVSSHAAAGSILGFARTGTIAATTPSERTAAELRQLRLEWYESVAPDPKDGLPTLAVLQDVDPAPGYGAFWGEVNSAIHQGLGCTGCLTNGSIRDLDALAPNFLLLAGSLAPSHAFVRVERVGGEVRVHGLVVHPGDLIHADRHGAVVIPTATWAGLADAIDLCTRREAPLLAAARAPGFTVAKLRAAMGEADDIH